MKIKQITYIDSGIIDEQTGDIAFLHTMVAVGFVVEEDADCIVLAREYDTDEDNWRGQIAIPKKVIVENKELANYDI